jgi:hypothetical protein
VEIILHLPCLPRNPIATCLSPPAGNGTSSQQYPAWLPRQSGTDFALPCTPGTCEAGLLKCACACVQATLCEARRHGLSSARTVEIAAGRWEALTSRYRALNSNYDWTTPRIFLPSGRSLHLSVLREGHDRGLFHEQKPVPRPCTQRRLHHRDQFPATAQL